MKKTIYLPTEEEIKEKCEQLQKRWDTRARKIREMKPRSFSIPVVQAPARVRKESN